MSLSRLLGRLASPMASAATRRPSFCENLECRRLFAVTLSASVGEGGVNRYGDVVQVQQRLRDLNFRSQGGGVIAVDGAIGPATISAIRLYQAAVDAEGDGDPHLKDGLISVNGPTHLWLNATNSPSWQKLVDADGAGGTFDIYRGTAQTEVWGTSWTVSSVLEATSASAGTEIVTALSTIDGFGSDAYHAEHQGGMDIDVNIDSAGRVIGTGALTTGERRVVDDMKAFYAAASPAFVTRLIVGYSRIRNAFNAETGTTLAVYDSGSVHDTHFHVDLRPAARGAQMTSSAQLASTSSTPTASRTASPKVSKQVLGTDTAIGSVLA